MRCTEMLRRGLAEAKEGREAWYRLLSDADRDLMSKIYALEEARSNQKRFNALYEEYFKGPPTTERMKAFTDRVHNLIKNQQRLAHTYAMKQVVGIEGIEGKAARGALIQALLDDYRKVQGQLEHHKAPDADIEHNLRLIQEVETLRHLNDRDALRVLDEIRQVYKKSTPGKRRGLLGFLRKTPKGAKLADIMKPYLADDVRKPFDDDILRIEKGQWIREGTTAWYVNSVLINPALERLEQGRDRTDLALDAVAFTLVCTQAWIEADIREGTRFDQAMSAGAKDAAWQVAQQIARAAQIRVWPCVAVGMGAYAAAQQGDLNELLNMIAMFFCPQAAIPMSVKRVGGMAKDVAVAIAFEGLLDTMYQCSNFTPTFDEAQQRWGTTDDALDKVKFAFVSVAVGSKDGAAPYTGKAGVRQFIDDILYLGEAAVWKPLDDRNELAKGWAKLWNRGTAPAIRSMLQTAQHTLFKRDPVMASLLAQMAENDGILRSYERDPTWFSWISIHPSRGFDVRFNADRTQVLDDGWSGIDPKGAEGRALEHWLAQRRQIKNDVLDRLVALILRSFESRRKAQFIIQSDTQNIDSALRERLEKLAPKLHLDTDKLVKAAVEAWQGAAAGEAEDRKDKAVLVIDQWVNAYEQICGIKSRVTRKVLAMGVKPEAVMGPNGPLSGSPPFILEPDEDLATARMVEAEIDRIQPSMFSLWLEISGASDMSAPDDPKAYAALRVARYELLIEELRFAGPDGLTGVNASPCGMLSLKILTDAEFADLVLAESRKPRSWWQRLGLANEPEDAVKRRAVLRNKAVAFNSLVNQLRVDRITAVRVGPVPLTLDPGRHGTVTLTPAHKAPVFTWRLAKPVPGVTLKPERGLLTMDAAVVIEVHLDATAREGVRHVPLMLEPPLGRIPKALKPLVKPRTVTFVVSVGPPQPLEAELTLQQTPEAGKAPVPLAGADVSLASAQRSVALEARRAAGVYGAAAVFPGTYRLVVKRKGQPPYQAELEVPLTAPRTEPWRHTVVLPPPKPEPKKPGLAPLVIEPFVAKDDGTESPCTEPYRVIVSKGTQLVAEGDGQGARHTLHVPPGFYEVRVEARGMHAARAASVAAPTTRPLRVALRPKPLIDLPPGETVLFKLEPKRLVLQPGERMGLRVRGFEMKGPVMLPLKLGPGDVTWTSSAPGIVAVQGGGVFATASAVGPAGTARITVSSERLGKRHEAHAEVVVMSAGGMDFQIRLEPEGQLFDVDQAITFKAISPMNPPPAWHWYIGSDESTDAIVRRSFSEPGSVTIRLLAKHPVSGVEDAVSRSITIRAPSTPPDDGTTSGETKPPEDDGTKGGKGTPIARRRNEFRLRKDAQGKLDGVEARGWRTMAMGWSSWAKVWHFGGVADAVLTVGDQADGCNTGFLLYIARSGRLEFRALGYDFKRMGAMTTHEGRVPLRGKKAKPGTLKVVTTQSRAAEFECRLMDGTLVRMRIWKIPKTSTSNVSLQGGVEITEWIPLRQTPSGNTKASDMNLVAIAKRLFADNRWELQGEPVVGPQQTFRDDKGRTYPGVLVIVRARRGASDKGHVTFVKMTNADDAKSYQAALFRMTKAAPGGRKVQTKLQGLPAYYLTSPTPTHQVQETCWCYLDVVVVLRLERVKIDKNLQDWARALQAMLGKAKSSGLPAVGTAQEEGPRIERLAHGSAVWPARLQDGVLEVQGCGYPTYPWRTEWKRLSSRAKDFVGGASGAGPIVAFTEDGKRWRVIELDGRSGVRRNERVFDARVTIYQTGRRGTVIEAGGRRFDLTDGQSREIDPKTGLYKPLR
ncbi:MAG: hypothetical protein QNJ90_12395 [Planctomycetota bacterium]|nr:hypothetical protein [Planctomycetota bacterium]